MSERTPCSAEVIEQYCDIVTFIIAQCDELKGGVNTFRLHTRHAFKYLDHGATVAIDGDFLQTLEIGYLS
jgi:hypothetical protein